MVLARLTILGCAVTTGANAIRSGGSEAEADANAGADGSRGNWTPARETSSTTGTAIVTAGTGSLAPLGEWIPLGPPDPTPAPSSARHVLKLRHSHDRAEDESRDDGNEVGEYDDDDDSFGANAVQSSRICATRSALRYRKLVGCEAGSFCSADNEHSRVGCCRNDDDDCAVPTTCRDWSPRDDDDDEYGPDTLLCLFPERCKTYSYIGTRGGVYDGYQMFACGRSAAQITAVQRFSLFDDDITTTSNFSDADPPPATSSFMLTSTTNPDPDPDTVTTGDGSPNTSPTANPSITASSGAETMPPDGIASDSNSSAAGATAGGVVGGVVGVALVAALVLFFLRRRRKTNGVVNDTTSRLNQDPAPSATYYPGPQDPPLHPTQYGSSSPPMSQATPHDGGNNGRGLTDFGSGLGSGAGASAAAGAGAALGADRRVSRVSRVASSYLAVSHKTDDDDEARPVSPISSNATYSASNTAASGAGPVSPTSTMAMHSTRYNRFNPPPSESFQAYRP